MFRCAGPFPVLTSNSSGLPLSKPRVSSADAAISTTCLIPTNGIAANSRNSSLSSTTEIRREEALGGVVGLTLAMAAGVTDRLWEIADIAKLVEDAEAAFTKRGPCKRAPN